LSVLCMCFFVVGVVYCVDWGNTLLHEVDFYTNNVGVLFCSYAAVISMAWVYNVEIVVAKIGFKSYCIFASTFHVSYIVFVFLGLGISGKLGATICLTGLIMSCIFSVSISYYFATARSIHGEVLTPSEKLWWLLLGNIETTRGDFNLVVAGEKQWWTLASITVVWSILMKYIIPVSLVALIANVLTRKGTWLREESGAPMGYSIIGASLTAIFIFGSMILGVVFPQAMDWLRPENDYCMVETGKTQEPKDIP